MPTYDIKFNPNKLKTFTSYAGVDVVTDANGKVVSGRMLMQEGIVIPELVKGFTRNDRLSEVRAGNDFRSVILELTKE